MLQSYWCNKGIIFHLPKNDKLRYSFTEKGGLITETLFSLLNALNYFCAINDQK
jgi:hypothetical protein